MKPFLCFIHSEPRAEENTNPRFQKKHLYKTVNKGLKVGQSQNSVEALKPSYITLIISEGGLLFPGSNATRIYLSSYSGELTLLAAKMLPNLYASPIS